MGLFHDLLGKVRFMTLLFPLNLWLHLCVLLPAYPEERRMVKRVKFPRHTSTKMVEIVLGKEAEKKIAATSLSNNIFQRRITDINIDIMVQVVEEIGLAPFGLFSIGLDKFESCSLLMAFVRYIYSGKLKE